jgi:hypothetical protein
MKEITTLGIDRPTSKMGIGCCNGRNEPGGIAHILLMKLQIGALPKYIFSVQPDRRSEPGSSLVQQTVQIVTSHDLTLFVRKVMTQVSQGQALQRCMQSKRLSNPPFQIF